jgi:hypothetical protein
LIATGAYNYLKGALGVGVNPPAFGLDISSYNYAAFGTMRVLSGSGNLLGIYWGRASTDLSLGIANSADQFITGTAAGDAFWRSANSSDKMMWTTDSGGTTAGMTLKGNRLGLGTVSPASTATLDVVGGISAGSVVLKNGLHTTTSGAQSLCGITVSSGIMTAGSACATGGGDAVLSATQTFSGADTFTSSVTLQTGQFSLGGGMMGGWWTPLSSGTFTSVSTVTITGLASSTTYHCDFYVVSCSANNGMPYIVFNQAGNPTYPTANNYNYRGEMTNSVTGIAGLNGPGKYEPFTYDGSANGGCDTTKKPAADVHLDFYTISGTSTTVAGNSTAGWNGQAQGVNLGTYFFTNPLGGTSLSDMELFFAAFNQGAGGFTISGNYYCYKRLQ